jgi:putative DNA primase/helicase
MEKAEEIAGRYRDAGQYMARMAEAGLMQNTKESMDAAMDTFRAARARDEENAGKYVMSVGKSPRPLAIAENVARLLRSGPEFAGTLRWNEFSESMEVSEPGKGWRSFEDMDLVLMRNAIAAGYPEFASARREEVMDGMRTVAMDARVNPPRDYLLSLAWDGVPRLATWLHVVFGTPADKLHADMGSNWLKGLAKRVLHPGCKFDEVLVIEGPQGCGKTTAVQVIGGPWVNENTLSVDDKDFYMSLAKNVVVEFSEGDVVNRTSSRKLKAIITKTEDQWRPPYGRGMVTHKRGCVFAMTTNDDEYQKDETGGRRWLPVVVTLPKADTAWLAANRDQLLAEAVHRVEALNETTWEYDASIAELQNEKVDDEPMAEPLAKWYAALTQEQREAGVRIVDAFKDGLKSSEGFSWLAGSTVDKPTEWRVSKCFKLHLGLKRKKFRDGNITLWKWVKA